MKLGYNIESRDDLYIAEIWRPELTPVEAEKVHQFGEPLIQVGGALTGTISRPGYTNTTIAFSGGGGSGATGTVVLNATGGILSITITAGGSAYASLPAVNITGVGTGASLQSVTLAGVVTGVTVISAGYGYQMTPAYVNLTLPLFSRRMLTDFPTTKVFSLNDTYDADAQALVWVQTVQANMVAARNVLLTQLTPLIGENVQTV